MAKKKSKKKAPKPQVADRLRKTGLGQSYSTFQFVGLAEDACKESKSGNNQPLAAIILSAIAVETFLNESVGVINPFLTQRNDWENEPDKLEALRSIIGDLKKQRSSTRVKLQIAHFVLTGKSIKRGEQPYQDFDLLVKLRDKLVHSDVEEFEMVVRGKKEYEPHPLVKPLIDREVVKAPPKTSPPQLRPALNKPEVAEWALGVALQTIKFLIDLFPEGLTKDNLKFMSSKYLQF